MVQETFMDLLRCEFILVLPFPFRIDPLQVHPGRASLEMAQMADDLLPYLSRWQKILRTHGIKNEFKSCLQMRAVHCPKVCSLISNRTRRPRTRCLANAWQLLQEQDAWQEWHSVKRACRSFLPDVREMTFKMAGEAFSQQSLLRISPL